MCGIFGYVVSRPSRISPDGLEHVLTNLFLLSESRGKEASGIAVRHPDGDLKVIKDAQPGSVLVRSERYRALLEWASSAGTVSRPLAVIGHTRLVTSGAAADNENNQPVNSGLITGIHNGVIANDAQLWNSHPQLQKKTDVDTEVLFALINHYLLDTRPDVQAALSRAFIEIEGSVSTAFYWRNYLTLATNTGSLYWVQSPAQDTLVFASESHILRRLLGMPKVRTALSGAAPAAIRQVLPGTGISVRLDEFCVAPVVLSRTPSGNRGRFVPVHDRIARFARPASEDTWRTHLRRCSRCVLPETMPFIEFDKDGVCNYCRRYKYVRPKGFDALVEAVRPYRRSDGGPEVVVAFSGGRDSSFGLDMIRTDLHLTPVAFTYDWGMVNDLARRNQARVCSQLGVEHIVVSADIVRKRENIRKNILAWLRKPDLGLVPLFMAGDKQFFYFAREVSRQTGAKAIFFCDNKLEKTDFKSGFCGVNSVGETGLAHGLSVGRRLRMASYYASAFLRNPAYLNRSLVDTLQATWSYYLMPFNFISLFEYVPFIEEEVERRIIEKFNWELAEDTPTSWRIGDGTAPFYNLIYYTLAGFSESDTFRSNQIREGLLTRKAALDIVEIENLTRVDSIRWYLDAVGLDYQAVVERIESLPTLCPK
jgi:hypothetical protein